MKIVMVYIYPEAGGNGHDRKAIRFLDSYHQYPPGMMHDTVIICNGGQPDAETKFMFDSLPSCQLLYHDDSGFDIGGYQKAARTVPADLMVFMGGNSYLRREGWLTRMVQAFNVYGDTLYGSTGNQGDTYHGVWPHVRTTGFWCSPNLINRHPLKVTHNGLRYEYEHGRSGLTSWVLSQGKTAWIVAWDCIASVLACNTIPNGFRTGNGTNILVGDRLTEPPYGPG